MTHISNSNQFQQGPGAKEKLKCYQERLNRTLEDMKKVFLIQKCYVTLI